MLRDYYIQCFMKVTFYSQNILSRWENWDTRDSKWCRTTWQKKLVISYDMSILFFSHFPICASLSLQTFEFFVICLMCTTASVRLMGSKDRMQQTTTMSETHSSHFEYQTHKRRYAAAAGDTSQQCALVQVEWRVFHSFNWLSDHREFSGIKAV